MAGHYVPNTVIVDVTASEIPAQKYLDWMKKGIHVITPNKKMNSGPLAQYRALKQFQRESYIHYLYEAGLHAHPSLSSCVENEGSIHRIQISLALSEAPS